MTNRLLIYEKYKDFSIVSGEQTTCRQNQLTMQHPTAAAPPPASLAPITHYENFPVASLLCPAHLRAPITALYHFARTADDLADEGDATAQQRLQDLRTTASN